MLNTHKKTQAKTLLDAFSANGNILTPSDILRLGIAQYNARIKELREQGYLIRNEYLGTTDGVKHTRFVFEGKAEQKDWRTEPKKTIYEMARENRAAKEQTQEQVTLPF